MNSACIWSRMAQANPTGVILERQVITLIFVPDNSIRSLGFAHLARIHDLAYMSLLADCVAIIGTLDLVFGEIDR